MANPNDAYAAASGKRLTPSGKACNIIEEVTGGHVAITSDHSNIHKGQAFSVSNKFTIANGASSYLEVIIPADTYVHFKPITMQSDGPKITVQLIEAPTITTGSTGVTPINRRRLGTPAVSVLTVKNNPTSISAGTIVDQDYIGGGSSAGGNTVSGGIASNDNEYVLKQATTYVVKVTNGGTGSSDVNIKLFWYEETAG